MIERRRTPRVPSPGRVYLTFDGRCRAEQLVDLSATGVGLQTGMRLRAGLTVTLFVPLPAADGWVMCQLKGQVARRTRDGHLGVALVPGAKDARHLLRAHLAAPGLSTPPAPIELPSVDALEGNG